MQAESLSSVDPSLLHTTVQQADGELILYRIPYASLQIGVLGENPQFKDILESPQSRIGWSNVEVSVAKGVRFGMMTAFNGGGHVESDENELGGLVKLHVPLHDDIVVSHYTHGRGIQAVLSPDLGGIRKRLEKGDWIFAVGNAAVGYAASVLAEKELKGLYRDREPDHMLVERSHGLLALSIIKRLEVDWRPKVGWDRQFDRLLQQLEQATIDHGIASLAMKQLGWDDMAWMEEIRIIRRVGAFNLNFDVTKARVMEVLNRNLPEQIAYKEYVASLNGGNYDTFVDATVDNLLTNYIGIPRE